MCNYISVEYHSEKNVISCPLQLNSLICSKCPHSNPAQANINFRAGRLITPPSLPPSLPPFLPPCPPPSFQSTHASYSTKRRAPAAAARSSARRPRGPRPGHFALVFTSHGEQREELGLLVDGVLGLELDEVHRGLARAVGGHSGAALPGGSFRTSTRPEIRAGLTFWVNAQTDVRRRRMRNYHTEGWRRRRFNVGGVLVVSAPPCLGEQRAHGEGLAVPARVVQRRVLLLVHRRRAPGSCRPGAPTHIGA